MSKNFKVGYKVRIKGTNDVGEVMFREFYWLDNPKQKNIVIQYMVKFGEGFKNWGVFSKSDLIRIEPKGRNNTPKRKFHIIKDNNLTTVIAIEKVHKNNNWLFKISVGNSFCHPADLYDEKNRHWNSKE